ncbi:MAG: hypothetical protein HY825_07245 [Acidobacteria bacterium]|nr:hypothetical protein [Acidobacteriota bacterium]
MFRRGRAFLVDLRRVFPWPLVDLPGQVGQHAASAAVVFGLLASRLLLLSNGPWEQDEALLACGVVDFDPANHTPLPPGFPLWIFLGRLVRSLGVTDPLVALQVASAVLSVLGCWALVGLWEELAGRATARAGALLAAFIPGVWYHAGRGFSETPSAALTIVALAIWTRLGRRGYVAGLVVLTAAALVRPPLAPLFVLVALLAAWAVRSDPGLLARGAVAAAALVAIVAVPALLEAGGVRLYWEATTTHAREHFGMLGLESWALSGLGFTRGLGGVWTAVLFAALAAIGWIVLRRSVAWRWWPATLAGASLALMLLLVHGRAFPRYWVLAWMLLAVPAVAGLGAILHARVRALAAVVAAAAGGVWVYPALVHIHVNPNPAIGALRQVAAEGYEAGALLVFDDSLFAFRNLAVRLRWLQTRTIRVTETARWGLGLGGRPVWFLTEKGERDLPSTVSQVHTFRCPSERVRMLSQERFLSVRLVRNPVLAWRGGSIQERDGTRRFMWLEPRSLLLLPPVQGSGSVTLAAEVHPSLGEVNLVARVGGLEVSRRRLAVGRQLITVPIPELPERSLLNLLVPVELEIDREVRLHGDLRPLAVRVFRVSVEAPPYAPPPYAFFPEPDSLLAAVATGEGTYGAELLGDPPRPAAWTSAEARFELPVGLGLVGLDLSAPAPRQAHVEIRLGGARTSGDVGTEPTTLVVPVPAAQARAGRATLELSTTTFSPGGGDMRELGVAVSRVWFVPSAHAGWQ